MNVRTQARTDTKTNALAKVSFFSNGVDRRWVALLASASVSGGSALLEVVAITTDGNATETVLWSDLVVAALPTILPLGAAGGLRGLPGQDLIVRLAAAGGGNVGRLNVLACGE